MPLEAHALLSAVTSSNGNNNQTPAQKRDQAIAIVIVIIIELALWVWAIMRALKCSQNTPDSRAIHLLFASVSPILYLAFSYFSVFGICPKPVK